MCVVTIVKETLMPVASIAATLAPLAFLACPVGMGLMMVFMGRGKRDRSEASSRPPVPQHPASLEQLREEQQRLGAEIERLEGSREVERS
jgi:hypothetical protein